MNFSCKYIQFTSAVLCTVVVLLLSNVVQAQDGSDSTLKESPILQDEPKTPFLLNQPSNVTTEFEYDPETGTYNYTQKLGEDGLFYRRPTYMTQDEYIDYSNKQAVDDYWKEIKETESSDNNEQEEGGKGFAPSIPIESKTFGDIFGGNSIDIRPSGSAELIFGINTSRTDNPAIPERQRRITTFDFDEKIQLNVIGKIGEKLQISTNYNTEATFDFENQMKLEYTGFEDEIIQKIELGNVSLPLTGSLITGSQSLFGIKTQLKFGKLLVTSVYSQQRGQKSEIEVQGGAQVSEFEVKADQYEVNRHFFLAHYFRDQYERTLENPVLLNTSVNITRIEIWVTNTNLSQQNTRSVIGFQDLGEDGGNNGRNIYSSQAAGRSWVVTDESSNVFPFNEQNSLYNRMVGNAQIRGYTNATNALNGLGMTPRLDYEKTDARMLNPNEYYVHPQLGYVSLNQELQPNQMLSVAYQYTVNGQTFQVGEFSTDGVTGSNALYLKMLKSRELVTNVPMWDLMMKNVYNLGAYQVQRDQFKLQIWYLNQETGVENIFIPEGRIDGVPLIQVLELDRVNQQGNLVRDGVFDFLDNPRITINPTNGRIYFPVLEPFGATLRTALQTNTLGNKYAFDSLYTNTQANAQYNYPEKNRFTLRGSYQSSQGSDISLNALNVPEGSVTVTAGGQLLVENQDYTVDYTLGRVSIINESILESGTPIKISLESNSLFAIQSKALFASRFDYQVNDDLVLGGTVMNLTERPLTQKINIGDEPISNTMIGLDGTWSTESQFLTSLVDKIPGINTKEVSTIQVSAEAAQLIPGHSRAVGKSGTAYIDDFEGSQSVIDIRSFITWNLASTPQGQTEDLFPEASQTGKLEFGYNRAKIAWYVVDPLFYRNTNITPENIRGNEDVQNNHYMREVFEQEIFPNRDQQAGNFTNIPILDVAYYPGEVGPYNYNVEPGPYGDGINADGGLNNPGSRWGGIMRRIDQNDFDAANIEFIQFWLMDPYAEVRNADQLPGNWPDQNVRGKLYFNLGAISEDILNDGFLTFENGLPLNADEATDLSDATLSPWGRSTLSQIVVNAFDNNPETREFQDVGLDGIRDEEERQFFQQEYIQEVQNTFGPASQAYANAIDDPSHDNYHFYRGDDYDNQSLNTLERYKAFNGMDGNSPTSEQSTSLNNDGYPTSASTLPNMEDINRDYTMDESESYYQYEVDINYNIFDPANVGRNYITDVFQTNSPKDDRPISWYQFKIPIQDFDKAVGNIRDFRSIRFMRMFMKGFSEPVYLRFARLELVRGEWRRYLEDLSAPGVTIPGEPEDDFTLSAVNIEENGNRVPINYVVPPDIQREINIGTTNLQRLNEQSLSMNVCDLQDGDARGAYRNVDFDVRSYKKLKMFIHAESSDPEMPINNGDLTAFVRIGTDFDDNYYEYELPLKVTQNGVYSTENYSDQIAVWPIENNVEIRFSDLQDAKLERNNALLGNAGGVNITRRYAYDLGDGRTIHIKGNPNFSTLKTVMVGVRNPKRGTRAGVDDDGQPKCAEIWFNELRLTDFDNRGGWAAIGRVNARLADFANVSASGRISTPGWGSIDKKVSERQRETLKGFDASTTIELGKFFPENTGIKLPMYLGYSQEVSNPQFAPLDPDLELDRDFLNTFANPDSVRKASQTFTERKSINFTNVRKERTGTGGGKPKVYDIENLSATYSYAEVLRRDINTEFDLTRNYNGVLSYNFSSSPKNIKPFAKKKLFRKSKYLRLIRDFNFYLFPKTVGFNTSMQKYYNEQKTRNNTPGIAIDIPVYVDKDFNWTRSYNLAYDLTRSLKLEFSANNNSLLRETPGRVSRKLDLGGYQIDESDTIDSYFPTEDYFTYEEYQDSLWSSIRKFGLTTNYNHQSRISYSIPFTKFPLTDYLNGTVTYNSTYSWQRSPLALGDSLGHTIQNSSDFNINGGIRMQNLYNKVPYLRKISRSRRPSRKPTPPKNKDKDKNGKDGEEEEEEKEKNKLKIGENVAKLLMSLKSVNVTYNRSRGILLPGYDRTTRVMGFDPQFGAPGFGFLFGQQENFGSENEDFNFYAARNDWLVRNELLATQYTQTNSSRLNLRANLEPIKDLRIDLTADRNESWQESQFFRFDDSLQVPGGAPDETGWWNSESKIRTGNYSVSIITFNTAFFGDDDNYLNEAYNNFLTYRQEISQKQGANDARSIGGHSIENGFSDGYGANTPDVLIPAFMAAYTGRGVEKTGLDPFKYLPAPNWRVTYTGLSKLEVMKKFFKTVTLNHSYRSTMNLSQYTSNLAFGERDQNTDFIPELQINTITISEQFAPFINVDMTWKNELITSVEFKKDRTLTLSMANSQLTEVDGNEIVIGTGYTFNQLALPFKLLNGKKSIFRVRGDVSFRTNRTVIRRFAVDENQPTAGQRIISIKFTGDYTINERLNLRLFYDRIVNNPFISNAFPTANTNAGFSIRFTLSS